MNGPETTSTLPLFYSIQHESLFSAARVEAGINFPLFLHEQLPSTWRDIYVAATARPTNVVQFRSGSFEYLYDLYSEVETAGEVPYDQTVENRVVVVFWRSTPGDSTREARGSRGWLGTDLPPALVHAIIRQFAPPGLRLRTAEPAKRSRTQPPSSL